MERVWREERKERFFGKFWGRVWSDWSLEVFIILLYRYVLFLDEARQFFNIFEASLFTLPKIPAFF